MQEQSVHKLTLEMGGLDLISNVISSFSLFFPLVHITERPNEDGAALVTKVLHSYTL